MSALNQHLLTQFAGNLYSELISRPAQVASMFYHDSSKVSRQDASGNMRSATTIEAISRLLVSMGVKEAEIISVHPQNSVFECGLLFIIGEVKLGDYVKRSYYQTLYLVPRYYYSGAREQEGVVHAYPFAIQNDVLFIGTAINGTEAPPAWKLPITVGKGNQNPKMRTVASFLTEPTPPRRREFPLFSSLGVNRSVKEHIEQVEKLEVSSSRKTNSSSIETGFYVLKEDVSQGIFGSIDACAEKLIERLVYVERAENGHELTILKPFNWIGARNDCIPGIDGPSDGVPRVLTCFSNNLPWDEPLKLVDGCVFQRTLVNIKDAIEAIVLMIENPARANGHIFNMRNPNNEVTVKQLAEMMTGLYSKVSGEPTIEVLTIDVSSKEFNGEGYDESDKRIPDMTIINKQLDLDPKMSHESALTYQHRTYAEAIKKAVAIFNMANPKNEVTVKQLAEMITEVYSEVSVEPSIEVPTIDVRSKEFYDEGYDDSEKHIPDMTMIKKQIGWDPKILLESTKTYRHRTYAETIKKAIAKPVASR